MEIKTHIKETEMEFPQDIKTALLRDEVRLLEREAPTERPAEAFLSVEVAGPETGAPFHWKWNSMVDYSGDYGPAVEEGSWTLWPPRPIYTDGRWIVQGDGRPWTWWTLSRDVSPVILETEDEARQRIQAALSQPPFPVEGMVDDGWYVSPGIEIEFDFRVTLRESEPFLFAYTVEDVGRKSGRRIARLIAADGIGGVSGRWVADYVGDLREARAEWVKFNG